MLILNRHDQKKIRKCRHSTFNNSVPVHLVMAIQSSYIMHSFIINLCNVWENDPTDLQVLMAKEILFQSLGPTNVIDC